MSKNIAIVFAGGVGARMGSGLPKQFIEVNGKPIIIIPYEILFSNYAHFGPRFFSRCAGHQIRG